MAFAAGTHLGSSIPSTCLPYITQVISDLIKMFLKLIILSSSVLRSIGVVLTHISEFRDWKSRVIDMGLLKEDSKLIKNSLYVKQV